MLTLSQTILAVVPSQLFEVVLDQTAPFSLLRFGSEKITWNLPDSV
jgi:hypothetical protein